MLPIEILPSNQVTIRTREEISMVPKILTLVSDYLPPDAHTYGASCACPDYSASSGKPHGSFYGKKKKCRDGQLEAQAENAGH